MHQILLVFAFAFAALAALFITTIARPPISIHFGWLAVAFYFLDLIIGGR